MHRDQTLGNNNKHGAAMLDCKSGFHHKSEAAGWVKHARMKNYRNINLVEGVYISIIYLNRGGT